MQMWEFSPVVPSKLTKWDWISWIFFFYLFSPCKNNSSWARNTFWLLRISWATCLQGAACGQNAPCGLRRLLVSAPGQITWVPSCCSQTPLNVDREMGQENFFQQRHCFLCLYTSCLLPSHPRAISKRLQGPSSPLQKIISHHCCACCWPPDGHWHSFLLTAQFPCLWALCWHGLLLHCVFILYLPKNFFSCLLNLFFPSHFPSFWSFCNLQPIEVYKDVHRRSELIGWADSQSASKERAAQNPSRQEGTGKRYPRGISTNCDTTMVNNPGLFYGV